MEFTSKENLKETTSKIAHTFWSKADENLENVIIKEEFTSDLKPNSTEYDVKNKKKDEISGNDLPQIHEAEKNIEKKIIKAWPTLKKKIRKKNQEELVEKFSEKKLLCLHDMKNFKIFKRRVRCGNCKTLVCPECCKIMFSTIQNHFSGFDKKKCGVYTCNFCCIVLNSVCALQAHIRIHTMETPYVCPDCGVMYNNIYLLILHLINKCFHVYKIVRYKCKNCPGSYFTPDTFLQHVQNLHMVCMFRCSSCSSLFNNSDEFEKHMEDSHQKQRVQYLNYFRCTLCSNVIIPRFMFEKHIDQHRKNSKSFEVNYQCLCGEVYSLMGAFRAHLQFCNKKGTLPSHWLFLQKKLQNHECLPLSNLQQEKLDDFANSNSKTDVDFQLLKSSAHSNNVDNFETNHEDLISFDGLKEDKTKEETNKSLSEDIRPELLEGSKSDLKKSDKLILNQAINNNNKSEESCEILEGGEIFEKTLEIVNSPSIISNNKKEVSESEGCSDKSITDKSITTSTVTVCQNDDITRQVVDEKNENKKGNETGDSCSKIFYDHIPCDHLGYLKIQCSELGKWESIMAENQNEKLPETSKNYHVVMELDEKTGLMVSKKIDIESIDKICDFSSDNVNEEVIENLNSKILSPKYNSDKGKTKVGNAFFTCPFCIVLFPKHNSTFQQFRLHLECYHPDAALNLTVNEIDTKFENEKHNKKATIDEFKPNLRMNKFSNSNFVKKPNLEICDMEKNYKTENYKSQKQKASNDLKLNDREDILSKEDCKGDNDKDGQKKNVFWTVKLSLKNKVGEDEEKNILEENNVLFSGAAFDFRKEKAEDVRLKSSEAKNQNFSLKLFDNKKDISIKNLKKSFGLQRQGNCHKENKNVNVCTTIDADEEFENNYLAKERIILENKKNFQCSRLIKAPVRSGIKHDYLDIEFAEDWENSKESNFCHMSDVELYSKMDLKNDLLNDSLKQKTAEKSKRESEVWSEFYESLQLAEKLKKTKKNKLSFQRETDQKSSFLPDYSSKRIVKKPKRYRQSSESEFSFEEHDFSNSESEFSYLKEVINKHSEDKIQSNDTDQILRKQELLNKLQNVDQKFVNYLFDLITKREKCFDLYKKHSSQRTSRHSQDLKIYRKKVLNGIKHRGRPLKMLRHQNIVLEKDNMASSVTENFKETDNQRLPKRKNMNQFGSIVKSGEKKRGRPRKMIESTKLKERRRSDKEVNFIEKNFEKEENDNSLTKRKRKLSSKLQYYKKVNLADEKDDFSSGQLITNKIVDSHKKFYCAVCKEIFQEPTEFKEHIIGHRLEENTYQCMECGECFVVRPSLEKHLLAFHKIKNTDRYITENQCCNIKKDASELEVEPLKENQCKVCKDQFERAIDLTKHFRIHGMAFLKEFKKEGKIK